VQRMVDEELITPEMAVNHPDLNILTRAIGKQPEVAIEVGAPFELYPGDSVLLCTDGLWGSLSEDQLIQQLSAERSAQETADALVQNALEAGSDDNITVQVIRIESRTRQAQALPPPAAAIGVARGGRRDATQPSSPAFTGASVPAQASAVATPSQSAVPAKHSSLVFVIAGTVLGLLLAGGAWFGYHHFHHVTQQGPVAPPNPCKTGEIQTDTGMCKPAGNTGDPGASPAQTHKPKPPCPPNQTCPPQRKKHVPQNSTDSQNTGGEAMVVVGTSQLNQGVTP
jgi:hypothetical protein